MKKYRLTLCREAMTEYGRGFYVLFGGTVPPNGLCGGLWMTHSDCVRLFIWTPKNFHKQHSIRLKPGEGPRVVTLEFAE